MSTSGAIYLDHAATTPVSESVLAAMQPFYTDSFGNPSSLHTAGRQARHAIEDARIRVSSVLDAEPEEIVFTGSGTESDNAAITAFRSCTELGSFVYAGTEHKAVLEPIARLDTSDRRVTRIQTDQFGAIAPVVFERVVGNEPVFASVMHVNNELGTVNEIDRLGDIVHRYGGRLHTDAVQSPGCYSLSELTRHVDYLSISGHKFNAPKGCGVLYVRRGCSFESLIRGGAQERGRRAGTENVAGVIGLAQALEEAQACVPATHRHLRRINQEMRSILAELLGKRVSFTVPLNRSSPHILHALFYDDTGYGLDAEMLILGLDLEGVYVSSGSACTSGALEPSHVLRALEMSADQMTGAIRFSFSRKTGIEDIREAASKCARVVNRAAGGPIG